MILEVPDQDDAEGVQDTIEDAIADLCGDCDWDIIELYAEIDS